MRYIYQQNQTFPNIVGRLKEIEDLEKFYNLKTPSLLPVYGRRRIGKTYLINEFCKIKKAVDGCIFFKVTGTEFDPNNIESSRSTQILSFLREIGTTFNYDYTKDPIATDWVSAFDILFKAIKSKSINQKIIIFFDEFPFFDTPKSNVINSFSQFWNQKLDDTDMGHVKTILCGSSTNIMLKKFFFLKRDFINEEIFLSI